MKIFIAEAVHKTRTLYSIPTLHVCARFSFGTFQFFAFSTSTLRPKLFDLLLVMFLQFLTRNVLLNQVLEKLKADLENWTQRFTQDSKRKFNMFF